jgi:hypothetical protein
MRIRLIGATRARRGDCLVLRGLAIVSPLAMLLAIILAQRNGWK